MKMKMVIIHTDSIVLTTVWDHVGELLSRAHLHHFVLGCDFIEALTPRTEGVQEKAYSVPIGQSFQALLCMFCSGAEELLSTPGLTLFAELLRALLAPLLSSASVHTPVRDHGQTTMRACSQCFCPDRACFVFLPQVYIFRADRRSGTLVKIFQASGKKVSP